MADEHARTYSDLVDIAASLIEELGSNVEYERGIINLLADAWGAFEMDTSTRMEEVARDIAAACDQRRPARLDPRLACAICWNHGRQRVPAVCVGLQHDGGDADRPAVGRLLCARHAAWWHEDVPDEDRLPLFPIAPTNDSQENR